MNHHLTLSFLGVFVLGYCQTSFGQEPVWLNHYGNVDPNSGFYLVEGVTGTLYGAAQIGNPSLQLGSETVTVDGAQDVLLVKWDTSGAVIWARTSAGSCDQEIISRPRVAYDSVSDHMLIGGQYTCSSISFGTHNVIGTGSSIGDGYLAAYDVEGNSLWACPLRGYDVRNAAILTDAESNVFVFGDAETAGVLFPGSPDIGLPRGGFIAKYTVDGELVTAERVLVNGDLNNADWISDEDWMICGTIESNGTLFGGSVSTTSAEKEGFTAKVDTTGVVEWTTLFPSHGHSDVWRCLGVENGKTLVIGSFAEDLLLPIDTLVGPSDVESFFVACLAVNGDVEWVAPITASEGAYPAHLVMDINGDILVYGSARGPLSIGGVTLASQTSRDGFVARLSPTGQCLSAWNFGRVWLGSGTILSTDHGLYLSTEYDSTLVIGTTVVPPSYTGPVPGITDLMIARFDSLSGFSGMPSSMLLGDELLHIYANPNNGLCTVELPSSITPGSDLVLTIFDASGRAVQRVPLLLDSGTIQLDIQAQAKGLYHVELQDDQRRYSGRIVFE